MLHGVHYYSNSIKDITENISDVELLLQPECVSCVLCEWFTVRF